MKHQIMYDNVAGDYYINRYTEEQWDNWEEAGVRKQEGHYSEVAVCDAEEDVEKELTALRGNPVFAVFEDAPAGEVFMSQEDGLSGNWRGNKHGHANLVAEFENAEEAEAYVQQRREYFNAL